jgi:hypothetical protein
MKKIFCIAFTISILLSCEKEDLIYSCDPEIDAIVKSGVLEFSKESLSGFLDYDISLQKAIYRGFTPEKQRMLWLEKIDSVMVNTDFMEIEIEHIIKLRSHITLGFFDKELRDTLIVKEREDFRNRWISFASDTLFWDISRIAFLTNSLYFEESLYEQLILEQNEISLKSLSLECGCSTESDYCGAQGGTCKTTSACTVDSGCGWLWGYDCNGACY